MSSSIKRAQKRRNTSCLFTPFCYVNCKSLLKLSIVLLACDGVSEYMGKSKYVRREYRAIDSWRRVVYIEFRAKVYSVKGIIQSVHPFKFWSEHGGRRRWNSTFPLMPLLFSSVYTLYLCTITEKNPIGPYSLVLYLGKS